MFCNVVVPQMFWTKWARRNIGALWVGAVLINVGMWFERFNIIVTSLHQDFIPSNWAMYYPTWVDLTLLTGTICFFGTLFLLFLKFLPAVAVSEVKELNHELHTSHPGMSELEGARP
jgi:molybdopterin-containing oxidoreductase family membrane subunit